MKNNHYRQNKANSSSDTFSMQKMITALIIITILLGLLFPIRLLANIKLVYIHPGSKITSLEKR
jgi:hypothetical protein